MRNNLLIVAIIVFSNRGCYSKWCDPDRIQSGESNRHHDSKKYRVVRTKQDGNICKVRYENKKESFNSPYENCNCDSFKVGTWVNIDSLSK
jgi:hypothetical protein